MNTIMNLYLVYSSFLTNFTYTIKWNKTIRFITLEKIELIIPKTIKLATKKEKKKVTKNKLYKNTT